MLHREGGVFGLPQMSNLMAKKLHFCPRTSLFLAGSVREVGLLLVDLHMSYFCRFLLIDYPEILGMSWTSELLVVSFCLCDVTVAGTLIIQ